MKYKKFQHKVTEEGLPQGPNFRRTNQSISTFGYSDFSPYRNEPYLDIFSPNGVIDMSNTGIPLLANGGYLAPYSGLHQFDTPWIREIPLMNEGGDKPRSSKIKDFIMGMKLKSRNVSKPYLGQEAFTALQTLPDYGFSDEAVLTSMLRGKEDWGAVGGAGSKSLHNVGRAFDVSAREDSEDFIRFINSPQGQKWMSDYHIDYLDETDKVYQGKAMPHHHFEFEKKFPKIRRGLKKSGVLSKDRLRELESEYKAYGDPKKGGLVEVSNYPGYQSDELPELVISPKAKPIDLTYIPEAESTYQINPGIQTYLDNRDFFKKEGGLVKAKDGMSVENTNTLNLTPFQEKINAAANNKNLNENQLKALYVLNGVENKSGTATEDAHYSRDGMYKTFGGTSRSGTSLSEFAKSKGWYKNGKIVGESTTWTNPKTGKTHTVSKKLDDWIISHVSAKGRDNDGKKLTSDEQLKRGKELFNVIYSDKYGRHLDNDDPNDGWKYRGRGGVQLTGKANYKKITDILNKNGIDIDLVKNPELAADERYSADVLLAFAEKEGMFNPNSKKYLTDKDYELIAKGDVDAIDKLHNITNVNAPNERMIEEASKVFGFDLQNGTASSETTTGGEDMSQYIKLLQGYLARGKKGEGSKTGVNPEQLKMMQQMMQMAQQQPGMMQQLGMTQAPIMPRITADEFKYKRRPRKTKIKAKNISVMKKGGSFNLHNSAKNSKLYNMGGNIQNQSTDDINSQRNSKFVEYLTSTSDAYKMDQMMKMMQESGITPNMLPIPQMNLGGMSSSDLMDMQNKDIQNRMDLFQSGMNMLDNPFDLVYDEGKSKIGRQKSLDKVLGTKWYEFGEKAKRNKAAREGATEMYKAQGYLDPETRRTFAGRMLHPFQPYRDTGYRDVKQNLGVQDFLEMNKQAILGVDKYGNPIGSNAYVGGFERAFPYLQTRRLGGSGLKRYQTDGEVLGRTSDEMLLDIFNRYLPQEEKDRIKALIREKGTNSPEYKKEYTKAIRKLSSDQNAKAEIDAYVNMMSRAINLGYNPEGRRAPLSGRFLFPTGIADDPVYGDYIMKEQLAQNNPDLLAYIESLNPGFLHDELLTADDISFKELLGGRNFENLPINQQLALIENFRRGVMGPDADENRYLGDLAAPTGRGTYLQPTGDENLTVPRFTMPSNAANTSITGSGGGFVGRPILSYDEQNRLADALGFTNAFSELTRDQQAAASPVVDNVDDNDDDVDGGDNNDTDDGGGDNNVVVNDGGDDNVVVNKNDEKDQTVVDTNVQTTPQGYWGMAPFLHANKLKAGNRMGLFGPRNKFKAKGLSVGFTPYYTGAMDGSQAIAPRPILPYEIVAPGTTGVVDPRNVDPRLIDRVRDKASDIVDNVRDRSDGGRRRERRINDKLAQYSAVDPTPTSTPDELRDVLKREKWLNKQERFSDREDRRNEREQRRQLNQRERELNKQDRMAKRDARQSERLRRRISRQYEQGGAFGHINTAAYGMGGDYNLPMAQLGRGMFSRDKENIFADLNENPGMYLNTRIQPTQGSTYSNFDNFQTERRFRDKLYDLFHPNTRKVAMTPGGFRNGGSPTYYSNEDALTGLWDNTDIIEDYLDALPHNTDWLGNISPYEYNFGLNRDTIQDGIYSAAETLGSVPEGTQIKLEDGDLRYYAPGAAPTNRYGGLRKYQGDEDGSEVVYPTMRATPPVPYKPEMINGSPMLGPIVDLAAAVDGRVGIPYNAGWSNPKEANRRNVVRSTWTDDEKNIGDNTSSSLNQALTKYAGDTGTYTQGSGDYDKRAFNQSMIKANPSYSIMEDLNQEFYNMFNMTNPELLRDTRFTPEWVKQHRANIKWQRENMPNQAYGGEQYKLGQEVYLDGGQIQDMINKGYKIQYF